MEGLIFVAGFLCGLGMAAVTLMVVGACVNATAAGRAPTPRDVLAAIAPQRTKRERIQRDDGPPEKLTAEEARERRAAQG